MTNTSNSERQDSASHTSSLSAHITQKQDSSADSHGPENHLALIYESQNEQLAAVVPFIRQGLKQNDRVMYIVDENTPDNLISAFKGSELDVKDALDSGQLTFHSIEGNYAQASEFNADDMVDYFGETVQEVVHNNEEYSRLRVTAEMTWAVGEDTETLNKLREYEGKLNQFFPDQPLLGLCQYNQTQFSSELLHDVIRAHPHQVYNATVTQNFAYLPPEEFFEADSPAVNTGEFVETHLSRIRAQSELEEREQDLTTLAESSQSLLEGDTDEIIAQLVETTHQALSPSVVTVFWYDEGTNELHPNTVNYADKERGTISLPDKYQQLLWDTFVTDDPKVFSNFQSETEIPELETTLQSGMALPVDRYGVLLIASTRGYAFEESDVEFATTIAATAQSALERAEHERRLEEQNEQLRYLNQINNTIRQIDQALAQASSREECRTVVCNQLVETDSYKFAWIGDRDPLTDQFNPQEWAGNGEPYLDALYGEIGESDETDTGDSVSSPASKALDTGEMVTVQNALTTTQFEQWREAVLANGFQSSLSIPLIHNNNEYGVLSVYADSPNVFSEMEQDVLAELGATTAYSIDAAETRASLHTDQVTEVGLCITDSKSRLLRLSRQIDGQLDVETVLPENGDELRLFFTVRAAMSDEVRSAGEESVSVETIRQLTDRENEALFECVLSVSEVIPSAMAGFGASVTRLTATPDVVEVTVELPQAADVREFVNQFQQAYPDTSVESVQRVTQPMKTKQSFYADVEDWLTDRQLEALKLAYHSGYFEWPRESSGEEVAESLGVSQPTFTGHLRAGERKLVDLLFDD